MGMMTDGLKLAAGPALQGILAAATRMRWLALGSGILVTALVQSSSAITVATIGFINAGLLSLPQGDGWMAVLVQLPVGLLMTVLMQSSSASIAITLTAAQGGLIGAQGAAAVVIGASIGTTVAALLAVIGATPNARRAATAHVLFNLVTAGVALALLPRLIAALSRAQLATGMADGQAILLALFALCDPTQGEPSCGMLAAALDAQEQAYQSLKAELLDAGAHGRIPLAAMEQALRRGSALRRAAQQMAKASRREVASVAPAAGENGD